MPAVSSCPSPELLRQLWTGELPVELVESLGSHLDECPDCLGKIQSLSNMETVANFAATTIGDSLPLELQQVLDRLRQHAPDTLIVAGIDRPNPETEQPQRLDFLAPPEQPDELGRLAHYRVLKVLGRGGMGCVLLAHDPHLDRRVALKVMLPQVATMPQAKERFLREARLAARLKSDHIVTIYQVAEDRGVPFLAMELLEGTSLHTLLESGRTLNLKQIVGLGRQIAEALAVAHEQGLIHRDIKPGNVWIESSRGGRVKLLDFGLARLEQEQTHLTQSGTILGTPAYMAPEQARGEKTDHRVDLWSLGVVLYELLTGRRPFSGPNTMSVLTSIAVDQPTPPQQINAQLPAGLGELVMRLLEKDPARRPGSARDVIAALDALDTLGDLDTTVALPSVSAGTLPPTSTVALSAEILQPSPLPIHLEVSGESPRPAAAAGRGRARRRWSVAATLLLALLPLGYFFGGTVIRFATNQGELLIEVDDPTVEIKIVQNGVVVQDNTSRREFTLSAGQGEVEVLEKDGIKLATKQFALTRGGKTTVKVTLHELADARQPKLPSPVERGDGGEGDPDRRVAEWVLSIGGKVRVNDQEGDLTAAELPKEPFRLTGVNLYQNQKVTDAELAHLKDCKNLTVLNLERSPVTDAGLAHLTDCKKLMRLVLRGTRVTDAGLAHLKDCKNLRECHLSGTRITDAGLAHLKDCKNLTVLNLGDTPVTDAGLAHLKDHTNLTQLYLSGTPVTDAGLAHLKDCKNLTLLYLSGTLVTDTGLAYFQDCTDLTVLNLVGATQVTDAGLAHFLDCTNLTVLYLSGTRVTDAGLAQLKDCKNLTRLYLSDTRVTDGGLAHLKDCKNLTWLSLIGTRVTAARVAELQQALPNCTIAWDGDQNGNN